MEIKLNYLEAQLKSDLIKEAHKYDYIHTEKKLFIILLVKIFTLITL